MKSQQDDGCRVIAIYTSNVQGFFHGEIINQIRQLCEMKQYRLVVNQTIDLPKVEFPIISGTYDGVIIIQDAIPISLAEHFLAQDIACVSIAYDYFPLRIPVVSSDSEVGVELAFKYLHEKNKHNILFIGDLSQFDVRKRFEFFCSTLQKNGMEVDEKNFIAVDDCLFYGGYQGASIFLARKNDIQAIVFGSGMTGIGFVKKLNEENPDLLNELDLVCFDALSMMPVLASKLVAIDQNLHLIAYRTLNCIEALWAKIVVPGNYLIPPKIIKSGLENNFDAFIATCVDLPNFFNANYMKAITCNTFEWVDRIAGSGLVGLMSIAPLFQKYMSQAFLGRIVIDKQGRCWIKHIKTFTLNEAVDISSRDRASFSLLEAFPPATIMDSVENNWRLCVNFPIVVNKRKWGVLTVYGLGGATSIPSNFFAFAGILEATVRQYGLLLSVDEYKNQNDGDGFHLQGDGQSDFGASIIWDYEKNVLVWSDEALDLFHLSSPIEKNIYRNIELIDRLKKDDVEAFRESFAKLISAGTPFNVRVYLRSKDGSYLACYLRGEVKEDDKMFQFWVQRCDRLESEVD